MKMIFTCIKTVIVEENNHYLWLYCVLIVGGVIGGIAGVSLVPIIEVVGFNNWVKAFRFHGDKLSWDGYVVPFDYRGVDFSCSIVFMDFMEKRGEDFSEEFGRCYQTFFYDSLIIIQFIK